jgi:hypothetical protein
MSENASPADRTQRFLDLVAPGVSHNWANVHIEISAREWTSTAEVIAALLTTLLLRLDSLCPTIHLRVPLVRHRALPRLDDEPLINALRHEHEQFQSVSRLTDGVAEDPLVRFEIGGDDDRSISIDVTGWLVGLRARTGRSEGIPVVAAYGAVLAANEVLQQLLHPFVRVRTFDQMVSLWDLSIDGVDGPAVGPVDLDNVAFAACGGVASATAWSLALHELRGAPLAVDPDRIDKEGTNLNRHLIASFTDLGVPKAMLLGAMLDAAGARTRVDVAEWTSSSAEGIDTVIASPDNDRVRRQVQLDLPRLLLAGGTGDHGTYRVASHSFVDGACGCCLWRSDLTDRSPLESTARLLGIDPRLLQPHITSDRPLPAIVLSQISDPATRSSLTSTPGRELIEHICATVQISPAAPAVSAPMIAAAPGVLLATELIKAQLRAVTPLREQANVLTASVFGGPHHQWTSHMGKRAGCECTDPLYVGHFRRKWPTS